MKVNSMPVLLAMSCRKTYITAQDDIEKTGWERVTLDGIYHDMSFVFEDGHVYLVYGNGEIRIVELESDPVGNKARRRTSVFCFLPQKKG